MYGLGSVPAWFGVSVGVFPPCRIFLKESTPFLCFYCEAVLAFIELVPMPSPIFFVELEATTPPHNFKLSIMVESDIML